MSRAAAGAHLQGASLLGAHLFAACLLGAHLQGAHIEDTYLEGAAYDAETIWPDGFVPKSDDGFLTQDD
jgi:uncharacterized protein YjbI with pentapeptide repeats